jgi:signal transduction histidine kinase
LTSARCAAELRTRCAGDLNGDDVGAMIIWAVIGRFLHGLVFFTLGLTVSFLRYRSRRVSFARHLGWLSLFAFGEALYAWYVLLTGLLSVASVVPDWGAFVVLGVAYTALLVFGIQSFMTDKAYHRRVGWMFTAICGLWLILYLLALWSAGWRWEEVTSPAVVVLRYTLAFPGGLLTGIGLRRQSYDALDPSIRRRIRPNLQLVEITMVGFGLLNLLSLPAVTDVLVSGFDVQVVGAILEGWAWAVIGAGMTYGLSRSLTTIRREIEEWVEGVERMQALVDDRERIGRELHDGIIQSLYAAGLLLESILPVIPNDPERAQAQLGRVMDNLNNTIFDIRRYIFDLRGELLDEDLQLGIEHLLRDFHVNTLLETEFEVVGTPRPIHSTARRRHIFQIVREVLSNTAKHARARWVRVRLVYDEESLSLMISDDGVGMEKLLVSKGYGLRNIRERARFLDGTLRLESAPGEGVTYDLRIPYA